MTARTSVILSVLLPALIISATFLASWTYRKTQELEGDIKATVLANTIDLTNEKIDSVDRQIEQSDNQVMHLLNPDDLDPLTTRWADSPDRVSRIVRSVLVLDENRRVVRHLYRDPAAAARFRRLFSTQIEPALHLEDEPSPYHRHLHEALEGHSVMVSVLTRDVSGRRYFLVLEADLDRIKQEIFSQLFDEPTARDRFNVTDEENRLVFGRPLTVPAEFIVGSSFRKTVYKWRLNIAAQSAPDLKARARRRGLLDLTLVSLSVAVLIAGVAFLAFAARNEERLNRLKSDFIATVSHELKTPLSLIRMFGEMLATERVPTEAKRREYLEIIVRESERLTGLIENVLDFAKVERGKAAYEFRRGNLGEVVAHGVDLFRYRVDRENAELRVEVDPGVPDSMLDERAMQLLLFNLLDNAVKYAGVEEPIIVRVRVARGGRAVSLEVEDGGKGIDENDARRIFDRFYRGKNTRQARGSGIGLALVKHIAEAHGGEVSVHNVAGRGACFTVVMPARLPASERADERPGEEADSSEGLPG